MDVVGVGEVDLAQLVDQIPQQVMAEQPVVHMREDRRERVELVGLGVEVREIRVALRLLFGDPRLHVGAIEAVEGIALDKGGRDLLTPEDQLEDALDRGGAGAGRAGDRNDRVRC